MISVVCTFHWALGQKAFEDGGVDTQFIVVFFVLGLVAFLDRIEHFAGDLERPFTGCYQEEPV